MIGYVRELPEFATGFILALKSMTTIISPPSPGTYAPFYEGYIRQLSGSDPLKSLVDLGAGFAALISSIPLDRHGLSYAEGKWTVKELFGHVIDTERIMAYRALAVARGEKQHLPGFDENDYVTNARFNTRTIDDLLREFIAVREASGCLFRSMGPEVLDRIGTANQHAVTPRALLYIILGHQLHHERVLRERYL